MLSSDNLSLRKYGTERCRKLLDLLGSPDEKLKIIHIAGTNGKGSTAAYITQILCCAHRTVGTFTSPPVYSYWEQFKINNRPVSIKTFKTYLLQAEAVGETMEDKPSPFESECAAALLMFYKEGCEYAVLECGLGGKDDATNAVSHKQVAVITSVSLEHTKELGNTLLKICEAKSGIIEAGSHVVVSVAQYPKAKEYFKQFNPIFAGEDIKIFSDFPEGQRFVYGGKEYKISLNGSRQCYNAATAIEVCRILNITEKSISDGLARTSLPGRIEVIKKGERTFILDGSHNPDSFLPLTECLKSLPDKPRLVFGCLADKDVNSIAKILSPYFESVTLFPPSSPRAMDIDKMLAAFSGKIKGVHTAENITAALDVSAANTVVICGSFTILKEAKEWIRKR